MVSFRGQKKPGPRPDRSPLGVGFKPFYMRSASPPPDQMKDIGSASQTLLTGVRSPL